MATVRAVSGAQPTAHALYVETKPDRDDLNRATSSWGVQEARSFDRTLEGDAALRPEASVKELDTWKSIGSRQAQCVRLVGLLDTCGSRSQVMAPAGQVQGAWLNPGASAAEVYLETGALLRCVSAIACDHRRNQSIRSRLEESSAWHTQAPSDPAQAARQGQRRPPRCRAAKTRRGRMQQTDGSPYGRRSSASIDYSHGPKP